MPAEQTAPAGIIRVLVKLCSGQAASGVGVRLLEPSQTPPNGPWAGVPHLPHGWRARSIPEDLTRKQEKVAPTNRGLR